VKNRNSITNRKHNLNILTRIKKYIKACIIGIIGQGGQKNWNNLEFENLGKKKPGVLYKNYAKT